MDEELLGGGAGTQPEVKPVEDFQLQPQTESYQQEVQQQPEQTQTHDVPGDSPLARALERLKLENQKLLSDKQKYEQTIEAVQASLGKGGDAKGILDSFTISQELERIRQNAAAEAEARVRAETNKLLETAKTEASQTKAQLHAVRRRQAIFDTYTANGGMPSAFDDFYALAGSSIEVDLSSPTAKVVGIKSRDGTPIYDESQKPLDTAGFFTAVRSKRVGTPALQACFVPYNQSEGVGSTSPSYTPDGAATYPMDDMQKMIDAWTRQGKDAAAEIRKVKWI